MERYELSGHHGQRRPTITPNYEPLTSVLNGYLAGQRGLGDVISGLESASDLNSDSPTGVIRELRQSFSRLDDIYAVARQEPPYKLNEEQTWHARQEVERIRDLLSGQNDESATPITTNR